MCEQSIVDARGRVWTGRLVEHRGGGQVGIDVDGKRYVGRKIHATHRAYNGAPHFEVAESGGVSGALAI